MKNKEKVLKETKNMFEKLKIDLKSFLFSEEKLYKQLLKKLKKSSYSKNNLLLRLINLAEQKIMMKTRYPQGQIKLREERLIGRPCIASMVPFNWFMGRR